VLAAATRPECLSSSLAVLWPRFTVALRRDCNYTISGSRDAVYAFPTSGAKVSFPLALADPTNDTWAAGAGPLWAPLGLEGGAGTERANPIDVDAGKFTPDFDGLTRALAVSPMTDLPSQSTLL
jgi:hypothetical protein